MSEEDRRWLRELSPGGILLLPRNLESPYQLFTLCQELRGATPIPPFIGIDQEGGIVDRLSTFAPSFPSNLALGATGNPEYAFQQGRLTAQLLNLLGINLNLAPVVDLLACRDDNGIGIRAYGSLPELVTDFSRAYLKGIKEKGVLSTLKHFPGLGRASIDPYSNLPHIEADKKTLMEKEVAIFKELSYYSPFIMVGHAFYPSLISDRGGPAALSSEIVSDLLKKVLGYKELVITDDLEMGAISGFASPMEATIQAIKSGNDMVMFSSPGRKLLPIVSHLFAEMEEDPRFAGTVANSIEKILAIKRKSFPPPLSASLQRDKLTKLLQKIDALSQRIAEDSIVEMSTKERNNIKVGEKPVVFYPRINPLIVSFPKGGSVIGRVLKPFCPEFIEASYSLENPLFRKDTFPSHHPAIIFSYNAHWYPQLKGFFHQIQDHFPRCFHISLGLPGDLESKCLLRSLAALSPTLTSIRAALRVLWGEIPPKGRLPVKWER